MNKISIKFTDADHEVIIRVYKNKKRAITFAKDSLGDQDLHVQDDYVMGSSRGVLVVEGITLEEIFPEVITPVTPKVEVTPEPAKAHVQGMKSVLRGMDILNAIHRDKEKKSVVAKRMGMSSVRLNYLLLKEERAVALALIKTSGLEQQFQSMLVDFEIDAHDTVDFKEEV